ncbi:Uncharacterized protein YP598_3489 [Yersinia pseudotuberculosis]|nr:Uncharacterized protein YP598_3489 [Yersinia pseudotuberculosis]
MRTHPNHLLVVDLKIISLIGIMSLIRVSPCGPAQALFKIVEPICRLLAAYLQRQ